VFIGASEGAGKFSVSVFAMNQTLQNNKKVVLIVSHNSIALRKCQYLSKLFSKKKVGKTFEDLNKDILVLSNMDVIVTTA
jgi:replicative superfamily II helicase